MADLVAAGAPELPAGYFYRVEPASLRGMIRVTVRRARRFGSKEVGRSVIFLVEAADELSAVVSGCYHAHRRWRELEDTRRQGERVKDFYGDHDPKGGR
ncbi:hypothetical protein [Streptomyces eurythermus]